MTPRARSARGEGSTLRDEVVLAAERLLLEHGNDDDVSIRAVAAEVGVTPPAIYRHFEDKTALILAVCDKQFSEFDATVHKAVKKASDPLEDLRLRGEAYIRYGLDHPEAYQVMFMRPPRVFEAHKMTAAEVPAAFTNLVVAVQGVMNAGLFDEQDPKHVAQVIWSVVHGLTSLLIAQPNFPWGKRKALIDDVLYAAISPFLSAKARKSMSK